MILLIVVILLFIILKNHIETEGDYTGYQLILTAKYGEYRIAGQYLSRTEKKIFNISEGDILYEPPFGGGLWSLNPNTQGTESDGILAIFDYNKILEIIELKEKTIKIKNADKTYNIAYNQNFDISPTFTEADGINYSYVIKIIKK